MRVNSANGAIQSPAVGGGHEISHAAEQDRIGDKAFKQALESPPSASGGYKVPAEEKRATAVEGKMAKELGEPSRARYQDSKGSVKACSPTSTKEC